MSFIFYLSVKWEQNENDDVRSFGFYKFYLISWTLFLFSFVGIFENSNFEKLYFLPNSFFFVIPIFLYIFIVIILIPDITAHSAIIFTMAWWEFTTTELFIFYLKSINRNCLVFINKDDWFNTQINRKLRRYYRFFSLLLLLVILFFYFIFFSSVILAFKITLFGFIIKISYYTCYYFYLLFCYYFLFLLIRSFFGIPSSWFPFFFELHPISGLWDYFDTLYDWYNEAIVASVYESYWIFCPVFLLQEHLGDKDSDLFYILFFWPNMDESSEWIFRFRISREWIYCKTEIFDCYTQNYIFEFFQGTKEAFSLITTRNGREDYAHRTPGGDWQLDNSIKKYSRFKK